MTAVITPIGRVVAGLHEDGEPVRLCGVANNLDLARTLTGYPSGSFALLDERAQVTVEINEGTYHRYGRALWGVHTDDGVRPPRVVVHGKVMHGLTNRNEVCARQVFVAPDCPTGERVPPGPQRIRTSAVGLIAPADLRRRRPREAWFSAIVQDVTVHGDAGRPYATCTLVGPEDGATMDMLVPAPVYAECGDDLLLGGTVRVHVRLARPRPGRVYAVAEQVRRGDDARPGTLFRAPLRPRPDA